MPPRRRIRLIHYPLVPHRVPNDVYEIVLVIQDPADEGPEEPTWSADEILTDEDVCTEALDAVDDLCDYLT